MRFSTLHSTSFSSNEMLGKTAFIWSSPFQLEMLRIFSSRILWQWALVSKSRNCLHQWNMPRSRMDRPRSWSHPSMQRWSKPSIRRADPDRRRTGEYGWRTSGMQWRSCKHKKKIGETRENTNRQRLQMGRVKNQVTLCVYIHRRLELSSLTTRD